MNLIAPWAEDHPFFQGREWAAGQCFYRWTEGSRVLLDLDGQGRAWASRAVQWLTEAGASFGTEVTFSDHCVALTRDDDPVTVWAGNGFDIAGPLQFGQSFMGPGWILDAESLTIDGGMTCMWIPGQPAIPLVHQVTGTGLSFLPAGLNSVRLDQFPFTKAEIKSRGGQVTNLSEPIAFAAETPPAASLLNRAEWPLDLPTGTVALALRKSYDRFHGRQRCRILINGVASRWWHLPQENRLQRPGEAWISVPLRGITGSITLALDPPAGVPLWSIGEIEIRALLA